MKKLILIAAIFVLCSSLFGQGMGKWPFNWGDPTTYVSYANPYDATGYIYHPTTYTWEDGTEIGSDLITITCDIEMYMEMHLDASDVYFHIADDRTSMTADIAGWLASNNGQWLFVSDNLGAKDLDNLVYVVDEFGRNINYMNTQGYTTTIPVEWYLWEPGDPDWRPGVYSGSGNAGQLSGYTWLLSNGDPCTHQFTIRIKILPELHQPDGRYEMDPMITCSPVL